MTFEVLEAVIDGLLRVRDHLMAEKMVADGHDLSVVGIALDLQHARDATWRRATLKRWRRQGASADPIKKLRTALSQGDGGA